MPSSPSRTTPTLPQSPGKKHDHSSSPILRPSLTPFIASSSNKHLTNTPHPPPKIFYHLSPHNIHVKHCSCVNLHDPAPETAEGMLNLFHKRFYKIWSRTIGHSSTVPGPVVSVTERIFRQLRDHGIELVHFVGFQFPNQNNGKKTYELRFMIMVPSSESTDKETGHRVVAEIVVHLLRMGTKNGQLETVAYRFQQDWTDWYFDRVNASEPQPEGSDDDVPPIEIVIENKRWITGQMILGKVYIEILGLLRNEARIDPRRYVKFMGRVGMILKNEGKEAAAFQIERVTVEDGTGLTEGVVQLPFIRIKMCIPETEEGSSSEDARLVSVATILIQIPSPRSEGEIPLVAEWAVNYEGDWPVWHQYDKKSPPPSCRILAPQIKL